MQPPNRTELFFVFLENYQGFTISHRTPFSYWIPFLFLSKSPSCFFPLTSFTSPFFLSPQSTGTSFSIKPTLLFPPRDSAASVVSVWGLRAFAEFLLVTPGRSRCFCGGSPANAEAAGHLLSPGSHVGSSRLRASGWCPRNHLLVQKLLGYFRDKDISSHCSFLCFGEFRHRSTSSVQREGGKSTGTSLPIPLPG